MKTLSNMIFDIFPYTRVIDQTFYRFRLPKSSLWISKSDSATWILGQFHWRRFWVGPAVEQVRSWLQLSIFYFFYCLLVSAWIPWQVLLINVPFVFSTWGTHIIRCKFLLLLNRMVISLGISWGLRPVLASEVIIEWYFLRSSLLVPYSTIGWTQGLVPFHDITFRAPMVAGSGIDCLMPVHPCKFKVLES